MCAAHTAYLGQPPTAQHLRPAARNRAKRQEARVAVMQARAAQYHVRTCCSHALQEARLHTVTRTQLQ